MDLDKLTPAPWIYDLRVGIASVFAGQPPECLSHECPRCIASKLAAWAEKGWQWNEADIADMEFIALARNDLDVKQRTGWHTEKCLVENQWFVPQLVRYITMPGCIEAIYQRYHDVGLLTRAYAWYVANVESKK